MTYGFSSRKTSPSTQLITPDLAPITVCAQAGNAAQRQDRQGNPGKPRRSHKYLALYSLTRPRLLSTGISGHVNVNRQSRPPSQWQATFSRHFRGPSVPWK